MPFVDIIYAYFQNESTETKKKKHLDFLDILITAKDDNDVGLTDDEIRAEVDTFLFAGTVDST